MLMGHCMFGSRLPYTRNYIKRRSLLKMTAYSQLSMIIVATMGSIFLDEQAYIGRLLMLKTQLQEDKMIYWFLGLSCAFLIPPEYTYYCHDGEKHYQTNCIWKGKAGVDRDVAPAAAVFEPKEEEKVEGKDEFDYMDCMIWD